jgi:membrane associated rhomboid family serine protease
MTRATLIFPLQFTFIMWLTYALQVYIHRDFGFLGILPRSIYGLIGLFTAPFVHGTAEHLLSNSVPFLVLGGLLFYFYPKLANQVFFRCYFFTNILVWLFARPFWHIGASGLVYGIAFFLISFGFFKRNLKSVLISTSVIIFYGGIIYTLFPLDYRVSWESHLFGAITGVTNAFLLRNYQKRKQHESAE